MHTEKSTKTLRTCRACMEKCIASSHRPWNWGGSSFFKVMEPNSSSRLDIPTDFMKRMKPGICKDAILQGPSGYLWHVNLCFADTLASFTDGWESFVSDQFIEPEDILVFRHVNDVHFSVQVFGPSGCAKQSSFSFQNYTSCCFRERDLDVSTICNKKRCEHRQNSTTASVSFLIDIKPNTNGDVEVKDLKRDRSETALDCNVELMNSFEMNATDKMMVPMEEHYICENEPSLCEENQPTIGAYTDVAPVGEQKISLLHLTLADVLQGIKSAKSNSSRRLREFTLVLQKSAVTGQHRITVPKFFVKHWMSKVKVEKAFKVKLLYEKKPKKWEVKFNSYERNYGLFSGWKAFAVAHELQQGDTCVFKLVNDVEYIFKVHVIRHGPHEDCGGGYTKKNVTSTHTLVPHEKSIIPKSMAVCKKGSRFKGSMVEYKGHNPVKDAYIQGPKGKAMIEVIELD